MKQLNKPNKLCLQIIVRGCIVNNCLKKNWTESILYHKGSKLFFPWKRSFLRDPRKHSLLSWKQNHKVGSMAMDKWRKNMVDYTWLTEARSMHHACELTTRPTFYSHKRHSLKKKYSRKRPEIRWMRQHLWWCTQLGKQIYSKTDGPNN